MADIVINPSVGKIDFFTTKGDQSAANSLRLTGTTVLFAGPISASSISTGGGGAFVTSVQPTTNYLSKFTGNSTIANSLVYDNGTNVGIGTTSPAARLQLGTLASVSTATPETISLGGTFSNSAGSNIKLKVYDDATSIGGMSVSSGQMEVNTWSSGKIAFYRGTTQCAIIADNGNVGIGTSSPSQPLHVYKGNNGGLGGAIMIDNNGAVAANETALMFGDGGASYIRAAISSTTENSPYYGDLKFKTGLSVYSSLTTRMIIKGDGNVGIGTSSPSSKLHVYDNGGSFKTDLDATYHMGILNEYVSTYVTRTKFGRWNGTSNLELYYDIAGTEEARITRNYSTAVLKFNRSTTTDMVIDGSGNVGIGTTSPNKPLDVVSNSGADGLQIRNRSADDYGFIIFNNYAGSESSIAQIGAYRTGVNQGSLLLYTGTTEKVRINNDGNVGIGTSSPSQKLHVVGTAYSDTDFRAPIFYDSNDPSYYLDPASTTLSLKTRGYINITNASAPQSLAMLNIGYNGNGETRAIDIYGGWGGGESKSITFNHGTTSADIVAQINAQHNGPGSKLRFGKLYHSGNSSTYTMELVSESATSAYLTVAGSVGIGTTNPTTKLAVSDGTTIAQVNPSSGVAYFGTVNNYPMALSVNSSEKVRILNDGNVGIGTSTPAQKLHVVGAVYGTTSGQFGTAVANGANASFAVFGGNSTSVGVKLVLDSDVNRNDLVVTATSGNIGIGTSSAAYKLDVFSSIVSRSNISTPRFSSAGGYVYGITNSPSWNQSCGAYTNNNATAPDGTTSAGTYTLTSTCGSYDMYQTISSLTVGRVYTIGMWVKLGTATNFCLVVNNTISWNSIGGKAFTSSDGLSTGKWTHISFTFAAIAPGNINIHLGYHAETAVTQQTAGTVFLWNIEMTEFSSTWIGNVEDEIRLPGSSIWTSRGNVGIGTTSPGNNLVVYNASGWAGTDLNGTSGGELIFRTSGTLKANIYASTSTGFVLNGGSETIFQIGASEKMRLTGANLGIGTTGPIAKLHVSWGTDAQSVKILGTGGSTNGNFIYSLASDWSDTFGLNVFATNHVTTARTNTLVRIHSNETSNGGLPLRVTAQGTIASPTYEALSVNYLGNVGIGTTAPTYKLEVNGTMQVAGNTIMAGNLTIAKAGAYLYLNGTNSDAEIYFLAGNANRWAVGMNVGDSTENLNIYNYTTATTNFTILKTNGNVGIGSTAPNDKLDVVGRVYAYRYIAVSSNAASPAYATDTSTGMFNAGSNIIGFSISSAEKVRIDASGNLGVGITSLVHKIQAAGLISAGDATYNNNSTFIGAILNNDQTNPGLDLRRWNGGGAGTDNHGATYIATNSAGDTLFYNGLIAANTRATNEKMRISVAGNVGIGTTTTPLKLNVNGSIHIAGGNGSAIDWSSDISSQFLKYDSGIDGMILSSYGNTTFYTQLTERVRINSSGNVGIGTTSPSKKLHVIGSLYWDFNGTAAAEHAVGIQRTVAGANGAFTEIGSLAASPSSIRATFEIFHHDCNTIEYSLFELISNYYAGTTTDWVQLPSRTQAHYAGDRNGVVVDARLTSNGANVQLRLRSIGGACGAMIVNVRIKSNTNLTETSATGTGATVAGLLGFNRYEFPVTDNRFKATTEGLFILNNGNIGIGTTGPIAKLEAYGGSMDPTLTPGDPSIFSVNSLGVQFAVGRMVTSPFSVWLQGKHATVGGGLTYPIVLNPLGGSVGIGTTSPTALLNTAVTGQIQIGTSNWPTTFVGKSGARTLIGNDAVLILWNDTSAIGANVEASLFLGARGSGVNGATTIAGGGIRGLSEDASTNKGYLKFETNNGSGFAEAMRIKSDGNVGIGTTSPATKLDVYGPVSVRGTNVISTGTDIFGGLSYDIYGNIRVLRSTSAQADGMYIGYGGAGGPLRFFSNSGTTEFMTIATTGNVGIGTTSPTQKLDVNGSINATSDITVNGISIGKGAGNIATNSALGVSALSANTIGTGNSAFGSSALQANTTGDYNTAVGRASLYSNTTGKFNSAFGYEALYSNTTAGENNAFGHQALRNNNTGNRNSAFGHKSLRFNSSGLANSGFGYASLFGNFTGIKNSAFGSSAALNTNGDNNCAFGYVSLSGNNVGANNCAFGVGALQSNTTNNNTAFGHLAGSAVTTGTNLTIIGYNAAASAVGATNEITLGNASIGSLRCAATSISSLSDFRDKTDINDIQLGLSFVEKLRPVTFKWDKREWYSDGNRDGSKKDSTIQTGFIAQELKALQEQEGVEFLKLVYESNPDKLEATPGNLMIPLIKAVQELSDIVKRRENRIEKLEKEMELLKNRL